MGLPVVERVVGMTSLLTDVTAMSALRVLAGTQKALASTENQISTGLRVSDASDNAAYWSIGVGMRSQTEALGAVNDSLNMTNSLFSVTSVALGSILTSLNKMKEDVVAAQQPGVSLEAVQSDIAAQQQSIISVANSASFNGVNLLLHTVGTHVDTLDTIIFDTDPSEVSSVMHGNSPNSSFNFDGSRTVTTVQNVDGETSTQTITDNYHQTWSDGTDGTLSMSNYTLTSATTGNLYSATNRSLLVPLAYSANQGLMTSSLNLDPLTLFSVYTNGSTKTSKTFYSGSTATPNELATTSIPIAYSYDNLPSEQGILDPTMTLVVKVDPSNVSQTSASGSPSGASTSGATPMVVDVTGITPPSSGGAPPPTSPTPTTPTPGLDPSERLVQMSILNMSVVGTTGSDLTTIGQFIDQSIAGIVNASAIVGSWQNQVRTMQSFNDAMADSVSSGVGSLVDADMNVASTRLQALQVQQQLGIQALSIANDNSKQILKLFG